MAKETKLQIVLVRYKGSKSVKSYAYYVPPWVDVSLDDNVVVEARGSIALGVVSSLTPTTEAASYASAYIIQVLNLQKHAEAIRELNEGADVAS